MPPNCGALPLQLESIQAIQAQLELDIRLKQPCNPRIFLEHLADPLLR